MLLTSTGLPYFGNDTPFPEDEPFIVPFFISFFVGDPVIVQDIRYFNPGTYYAFVSNHTLH